MKKIKKTGLKEKLLRIIILALFVILILGYSDKFFNQFGYFNGLEFLFLLYYLRPLLIAMGIPIALFIWGYFYINKLIGRQNDWSTATKMMAGTIGGTFLLLLIILIVYILAVTL